MVIAGSDRATRRRVGRRQRDVSPVTLGHTLRDAREGLEITLAELHDRTGVPWRDLEALEEGDLARLADRRTALVAVRRYAEVVGLDGDEAARTVTGLWQEVVSETGSRPAAPAPGGASAGSTSPTGHLSRYPGDASHLRAFTQTDQVPHVGPRTGGARSATTPGPSPARVDATDAHPVTLHFPDQPRPAPLALLVAVWVTALLLAVGVAGLAVHHWRPAWLAKIHLVPAAAAPAAAHHATHPSATTTPALVTETTSGPGAATVTVRAPQYAVVLSTQGPCWVRVSDPTSFLPVFTATVPSGTTKTFTSGAGQLSIELGASRVSLVLQVQGKDVPGWSFAPSAAPFVVNFRSSAS